MELGKVLKMCSSDMAVYKEVVIALCKAIPGWTTATIINHDALDKTVQALGLLSNPIKAAAFIQLRQVGYSIPVTSRFAV
jgi:hypothetical protein